MGAKPRFYDGPRMTDLSLEGEAAWVVRHLAEDLEKDRTVLGFQGWTHSPSRFLQRTDLIRQLRVQREKGTAVVLQVTFTGLGGTMLEPGIRPTREECDALQRLVDRLGTGWEAICARIDPLQSFRTAGGEKITNLDRAKDTLHALAGLGVRRFRTSLIQYRKYRARIAPRLRDRGLQIIEPSMETLQEVTRTLLKAATEWGAELRSCASDLPSIPPGACFDLAWMRDLCGLPEREVASFWEPEKPVAPRAGCLCAHPTAARMLKIPGRTPCPGGCVACYAQPLPIAPP
ncbi:MAG: DUF1848 family protein [Planctomycetota bacterium]|jgi:hypothetical protein